MRAVIIGFLLTVFVAVICDARIIEVPSDLFPTIQSGIDSSIDGDTIFIASGVYVESLRLAGRSLTIIGAIEPDTAFGMGTIIDPAGLDSSQNKPCLEVIGGDSVKIERLWFRNGREMHLGRPSNSVGGIDNRDGAAILSLTDCRFDSVYCGIYGGGEVVLYRVLMQDCRRFALFRSDTTRFDATDCRFHGATSLFLVHPWSGSRFTRCHFRNDSGVDMLYAARDSILIRACVFGPFSSECGNAVYIRAGRGTIIEQNLFHECVVGTSVLEVAQASCSTDVVPEMDAPIISGNTFRDNSPLGCQGGHSLELHCDGGQAFFLAIVEHNIFENLYSHGIGATGVYVFEGAVEFNNNRFTNLFPDQGSAIFAHGVVPPETLMLRNNWFDSLAFAVRHESDQQFTDARWNWWGDDSGPFNPFTNPEGLGAGVDNDVLFEPWLTMADTSVDNSPDETSLLLANTYSLFVYPNPFNAVTTLEIEVGRVGDYDVILYDVTGRVAAEVFTGRIDRRQSVSLNADGLSSGVYFARLSGGEGALAVSKVLLLN